MKRSDILFLAIVIVFFLPFFTCSWVYNHYVQLNAEHGMIMSFIKFALLATLGEVIALRIKKGVYNEKGFGILPRALVWGFLGLAIKMAFTVFATGIPVFLEYLGVKDVIVSMKGGFSGLKLFSAFSISTAMNLIFAPVMMTFHKITDTHILQTGGTISGFFSKINFGQILKNMNWDVMWNFVFKKTIPFFWIPAHTITFLLPAEYQILFAAVLGIALGLILAIASLKGSR